MKLKTIIKIFAIIAIVSIIQSLNINAAGNWNPSSITTATPGTSVPGLLEDNFNALENVLDTAAPTALLINGAKIKAGTVPLAALAANSVNSSKVVDNSLTSYDLAPHSVATSELDDDAVTTDKIDSQAVTSEKILDGTIAAADLSSAVQADIDAWESGGTMSGALKIHVYTPDKLTLTPYSDTRTYVKNQMNDASSGVNWYYDIMLGNTDPAKDVIAMRWWIDGNNEMSLYDSYLDVKNNKISNLAAGSAGTDAANITQIKAMTNNFQANGGKILGVLDQRASTFFNNNYIYLDSSSGGKTYFRTFTTGAGFKFVDLDPSANDMFFYTNALWFANPTAIRGLGNPDTDDSAVNKAYADTKLVAANGKTENLQVTNSMKVLTTATDYIDVQEDKIIFRDSATFEGALKIIGGVGAAPVSAHLIYDYNIRTAEPALTNDVTTKQYVDNATNYFQANGGKILASLEIGGMLSAASVQEVVSGPVNHFAATKNYINITASSSWTIEYITGGKVGEYILTFADSNTTITDSAPHTPNINLSASFTSTPTTVLKLYFDGTNFREVSRSVN